MFTGIIEECGKVVSLKKEQSNLHIEVETEMTPELKIDQSVAHNGVCLTVVKINGNKYTVTAIDETLKRTNLDKVKVGDIINLERCLPYNGRLDGHIVQGHVDETGVLSNVKNEGGSYILTIGHSGKHLTVEKGSIAVNGISLTVVASEKTYFTVAIIPYTWKHTNLKDIQTGDLINLEFDILGKYVQQLTKFK